MSFYQGVFNRLPVWLKRRIFPLDYGVRSFIASLEPSAKDRVLDAGAGEVRFADAFGSCRYITLDSAVGDEGWDYSRIDLLGRLEAIPLAAECVDFVINTQVLEHVRSPEAVLEEIGRVLRPGGVLALTAPQGWHEHQQPNDFFRFTRFSLQMLLERAGFSDIEISPIGGYFHYLGHRLTFIPKILFQGNRTWIRVLLFPLEFVSLAVFCFALPLVCFYLDRLDLDQKFTLCYRCRAVKRFVPKRGVGCVPVRKSRALGTLQSKCRML